MTIVVGTSFYHRISSLSLQKVSNMDYRQHKVTMQLHVSLVRPNKGAECSWKRIGSCGDRKLEFWNFSQKSKRIDRSPFKEKDQHNGIQEIKSTRNFDLGFKLQIRDNKREGIRLGLPWIWNRHTKQ